MAATGTLNELLYSLQVYTTLNTEQQTQLYQALMQLTENKINDRDMLWGLAAEYAQHKNNHLRSIGGQLICRLVVANDEAETFFKYDSVLKAVTHDEKFVTSRHTIRSLWYVSLGSEAHFKWYIEYLKSRLIESFSEKNGTMVRMDIFEGMICAREFLKEKAKRTTEIDGVLSMYCEMETHLANQKKMKKLLSQR